MGDVTRAQWKTRLLFLFFRFSLHGSPQPIRCLHLTPSHLKSSFSSSSSLVFLFFPSIIITVPPLIVSKHLHLPPCIYDGKIVGGAKERAGKIKQTVGFVSGAFLKDFWSFRQQIPLDIQIKDRWKSRMLGWWFSLVLFLHPEAAVTPKAGAEKFKLEESGSSTPASISTHVWLWQPLSFRPLAPFFPLLLFLFSVCRSQRREQWSTFSTFSEVLIGHSEQAHASLALLPGDTRRLQTSSRMFAWRTSACGNSNPDFSVTPLHHVGISILGSSKVKLKVCSVTLVSVHFKDSSLWILI